MLYEGLYILKSGRLRRKENTLEFESNTSEKRSIPVNDIYSIHVFGEIDLNTKLIIFLNQNGIPLHFYNYYGYYSGSYYPREKLLSGFLIIKQVENYIDIHKRLILAKEFVRVAIHNILSNLKHYKKNGKDVTSFISKIENEVSFLDDSTSIDEIMGIEGRIRNIYYSSFDSFLR